MTTTTLWWGLGDGDDGVVPLAGGMNNLDAVCVALGGALSGLSLEHEDHVRLQPPLTHGRPHLFGEA